MRLLSAGIVAAVLGGALVVVNCGHPSATPGAGGNLPAISFNRDIRPILSENCFACHGPDSGSRKGELRLDLREAALKGHAAAAGAHAAIVPAASAQSEMIRRVTMTGGDQKMPPASTGKTLKPEEIELLKRWIDEGAQYEPHWSYIPPTRPAVPEVKQPEWVRNPIDHFILARLEQEGLQPSPQADRRTLIRRLHADLTGIPPTAQEVAAFVADQSPDAYEKLVDGLIASPHFGERMALPWLDLVRYADSNGYHGDQERQVWAYRDYVINAFNSNMPYDRFTIEQLAGDLIPERTTQTLVATGYNRLNMVTAEGGAQDKEYLAKYAADRVRTTSSVWLGSTMGCAECHDHKFDPISIREFYGFEAFFADLKETGLYAEPDENFHPYLRLPNAKQKADYTSITTHIENLRAGAVGHDKGFAADQAAWETATREKLAAGNGGWRIFDPETLVGSNNVVLIEQSDHSVVASGFEPSLPMYSVEGKTELTSITAVRVEVMTDPGFAGLGRWNGNSAITLAVARESTSTAVTGRHLKFAAAAADFELPDYPVASLIADPNPGTGWQSAGHVRPVNRQLMFVFEKPVGIGPDACFKLELYQQSGQFFRQGFGRFRVSLSTQTSPSLAQTVSLPESIEAALLLEPAQRSAEQSAALSRYYSHFRPQNDPAFAQIQQQLETRTKLEKEMDLSLIAEATDPRAIRVLARGNWLDETGEIVEPHVPAAIAPTLETGGRRATRLDLAHWIASRENPLTARVFVNRLWKTYYGLGISRTLDDLGLQGEWPRHPELLDWLAVEFMESGWDIKHMVRLMVTSEAYRQDSNSNERLHELDPNNRLIARQSSYRMDAELLRDNALAISGLLVPTVGGKSTKPYQPAGYWDGLNFPVRSYPQDTGERLYRRGIYTHWQRTFLNPELRAFDAPSREECTAERTISNTPLQALTLLNAPTYFEAARVFAQRILREGGASTPERIGFAFRSALSREPTPQELPVIAGLYEKHLAEYRADDSATSATLHVGETPLPEDVDHAELAAMTSVARTVLNLHETIMRY